MATSTSTSTSTANARPESWDHAAQVAARKLQAVAPAWRPGWLLGYAAAGGLPAPLGLTPLSWVADELAKLTPLYLEQGTSPAMMRDLAAAARAALCGSNDCTCGVVRP